MIQIQRVYSRQVSIVLVLLMVFVMTMTGFAYNDKTVVVMADGAAHTVKTHLNSPDGIVRDAGIILDPHDKVIADTASIQDGSTLTVVRAFPVTVVVDGHSRSVLTVQRTAQGLADELGFKAPNYTPVEDNPAHLGAGSVVKIARVTSRSENRETKTVPIQMIRQKDDTLAIGEENVVQQGKEGSENVVEEVLYSHGQVVKTNVVSKETVTQMVPTIIKEGTRDIITSRNAPARAKRVITMEATAYLPSDGGGSGITATGIPATHGVVAVDPDVIPLGTRVYIPGYGEAIAADTGGAIVGNRIDLVMMNYQEAMNFGRRSVTVYVMD